MSNDIDYDNIPVVDVNDDLIEELETLNDDKVLPTKTPTKKKSEKPIKNKGIVEDELSEEFKLKYQLIMAILRYKNVFPQYMALYIDKMEMEYLKQLSIDELTTLLQEIRVTVADYNSISLAHHSYYGALTICERIVAPSIGINIDGISQEAQKSEAINNLLNEISLEMDIIYVKPQYRLLITTVGLINMVMQANKVKEKQNLDQPYNDNNKDEFNDI